MVRTIPKIPDIARPILWPPLRGSYCSCSNSVIATRRISSSSISLPNPDFPSRALLTCASFPSSNMLRTPPFSALPTVCWHCQFQAAGTQTQPYLYCISLLFHLFLFYREIIRINRIILLIMWFFYEKTMNFTENDFCYRIFYSNLIWFAGWSPDISAFILLLFLIDARSR